VNSDCPVRHRTVRCDTGLSGGPGCQSSNGRNRQNSNGWVTWLAHRTVFGGAPDCPVRPSTAATPTIQAFSSPHSIQEQSTTLQDTNQSLRSNQSPQFNSSVIGLVRGSFRVSCCSCLLGLAFFSFSLLTLKCFVSEARDTNCVVILAGSK
jgi:hypothetical protein